MIKKTFTSVISVLFFVSIALTGVIAIFLHDPINFYLKHYASSPLLGNLSLSLIAASLWIIALMILHRTGVQKLEHVLARFGLKLLVPLVCLTAMLQVFIAYHTYFLSSWDARYVVDGAHAFASGHPEYIDTAYFSLCPNNMALVALYGAVGRLVNGIFHIEMGKERFALLLILLQIVLNNLTGIALFTFVRRMVRKLNASDEGCPNTAAFSAWLIYLPLIACSPWFLVPYSDSTALLIPILSLLLLTWRKDISRPLYAAIAVGLLGGLGFLIKPQSSIVLIAAVIVEFVHLFCKDNHARRTNVIQLAAMLFSAWIMIIPFNNALIKSTQVDLDKQAAVGVTHFLNMGLNPDTNGAYSYADLLAASAVPANERTLWGISSALKRLSDMDAGDYIDHTIRKSLINFSDGSFAWGVDFAYQLLDEKDSFFSPLLRNIFYSTGEYYPILLTIQQAIWLSVLFLSPIAAIACKRSKNADLLSPALLSIIGILFFNMIFEAKARYIMIYAPVLIAVAMIGLALTSNSCKNPPFCQKES